MGDTRRKKRIREGKTNTGKDGENRCWTERTRGSRPVKETADADVESLLKK